jgi:hypothetical protein
LGASGQYAGQNKKKDPPHAIPFYRHRIRSLFSRSQLLQCLADTIDPLVFTKPKTGHLWRRLLPVVRAADGFRIQPVWPRHDEDSCCITLKPELSICNKKNAHVDFLKGIWP